MKFIGSKKEHDDWMKEIDKTNYSKELDKTLTKWQDLHKEQQDYDSSTGPKERLFYKDGTPYYVDIYDQCKRGRSV